MPPPQPELPRREVDLSPHISLWLQKRPAESTYEKMRLWYDDTTHAQQPQPQSQPSEDSNVYTDDNFHASAQSLTYDNKPEFMQLSWARASSLLEREKLTLFGEELSLLDVAQGSLRDCYFLTSLQAILHGKG